jgi:hypothetical protein
MNTSTAPMPRIHGQTLRFCGAIGGMGDHWGGGVEDGGICPGPYAIVGCGDVSRDCGYWMVALGSTDDGALALTNGEPSSKQKLRASSVYVRLHCGQRFILWPRFVIVAAGQRRLGR